MTLRGKVVILPDDLSDPGERWARCGKENLVFGAFAIKLQEIYALYLETPLPDAAEEVGLASAGNPALGTQRLGTQRLGTQRYESLLEFRLGHPEAICRPSYDGHARHPVLLPSKAFSELRRSEALTLRDFLETSSCPRAEIPIADSGLALDLDRPTDYEIAAKLSLSRS